MSNDLIRFPSSVLSTKLFQVKVKIVSSQSEVVLKVTPASKGTFINDVTQVRGGNLE